MQKAYREAQATVRAVLLTLAQRVQALPKISTEIRMEAAQAKLLAPQAKPQVLHAGDNQHNGN